MCRKYSYIAFGMVTVFISGCAGGGFSVGYYDHRPVRQTHVYVEPEPVYVSGIHVDHVCGEHCYDHYYNGSRVIVLGGHHHSADCGHRWDGHYWVTLSALRSPRHRTLVDVHVCSEHCSDHYYDGHSIVTLGGHHHSHNCGHHWDGRHWVISIGASYKRSNDAHRSAQQPRKYKVKGHHKSKKIKKSKGHH